MDNHLSPSCIIFSTTIQSDLPMLWRGITAPERRPSRRRILFCRMRRRPTALPQDQDGTLSPVWGRRCFLRCVMQPRIMLHRFYPQKAITVRMSRRRTRSSSSQEVRRLEQVSLRLLCTCFSVIRGGREIFACSLLKRRFSIDGWVRCDRKELACFRAMCYLLSMCFLPP